MFKFNLMPRGDKFFDLFEVSSKNMVKAAQSLKDLIYIWDCIDQKLEEMDKIEHQGDTITHEIMFQLNRSLSISFSLAASSFLVGCSSFISLLRRFSLRGFFFSGWTCLSVS